MQKPVTIDLNCDLGESSRTGQQGNDEAIMPWITSANIACGFHAGDPVTMMRTIKLALESGVKIGAHPGYADLENFGRKEMHLTTDELKASLLYQIGALKSMAEALGSKLRHVKPHGALYNQAAVNREIARTIADTIMEIDDSLVLFGLSGSELTRAAEKAGLTYASEVFADRGYNDDGTLVSRSSPGAVLHNIGIVTAGAVRMVTENTVISVTGKIIPIKADTICIHGDNEMAADFARNLVTALKVAGIELKPFTT